MEGLPVHGHFHAAARLVVADGGLAAFALELADLLVVELQLLADHVDDGALHLGHRHAVLGPFRAGQAGHHIVQVQLQHVAEFRVRIVAGTPQTLRLAVGFHQRDVVLGPVGQLQVFDGAIVDREEAAGGAVFRCHVADGGAVRQAQIGQAVAEELHELADHAPRTEHLGDRQHQVGGGHAFAHFAGDLEAHHFGNQHRHRLAEHGRFRFDAAHAPAEHAQAVDHGGVGVGAHQGVRVGEGLAVLGVAVPDAAAQVFQVHLVADAGARRYHAEIIEGVLAPAQELIALLVALVFPFHVLRERLRGTVFVHHHRVVDDQIHRCQRVDSLRVAAGLGDRIAHGGQIDHTGYAGEVLHQDPCRAVIDFAIGSALLGPTHQAFDVLHGDGFAVFVAEQVFQKDLEGKGKLAEITPALIGDGIDIVIMIGLAADIEGLGALQGVLANPCHCAPP